MSITLVVNFLFQTYISLVFDVLHQLWSLFRGFSVWTWRY